MMEAPPSKKEPVRKVYCPGCESTILNPRASRCECGAETTPIKPRKYY